jgi:hypothetical protein
MLFQGEPERRARADACRLFDAAQVNSMVRAALKAAGVQFQEEA